MSGGGQASIGDGMISVTEDGGVALDGVAFKSGSADLTDEGTSALRELANILNNDDNREFAVYVVGHTDNTRLPAAPTANAFGDNWGLSAMRAATVLRALEAAGVDSQRLRGSFRGEHQPAQTGNGRGQGRQPPR